MKTRNISLLTCACMAAVAFVALAAEEPQARPARPARQQQPERMQRPMPGRVAEPNLPVARENALREAMARRMQTHQEEISKLNEIVKIAEEENATKTVEALKALIAEKDREVKDQIDQAERRRQEMQQRLQERLGERATERPGGPAPAGAGRVRPEDEQRTPRPGQPVQRQRGAQPRTGD